MTKKTVKYAVTYLSRYVKVRKVHKQSCRYASGHVEWLTAGQIFFPVEDCKECGGRR